MTPERQVQAMNHRLPKLLVPIVVSAILGGLLSSTHSAPTPPPAAPPVATGSGSGFHHFRHYGHYHHYGHYSHYGHYQHSGSDRAGTFPVIPPDSGGDEESFVRDGRRYYWHNRDGHRFYSSHPEPGDTVGPDLGIGEDLDAPLSPEEYAERAARMQHAQARLAAVEKRVARQRHLVRLRELAAKPRLRHNAPSKRPQVLVGHP